MSQPLDQGVVCALGREDAKRVFSARDNEALIAGLTEFLGSAPPEQVAKCKGRWAVLHRLLEAGTAKSEGLVHPVAGCLLGGRHLQRAPGLVVSMVRPDMVPIIAEALDGIDRADFAFRCQQLDRADVAGLWELVTEIATVYGWASKERAAVAFAVMGDVDEYQQ